MPIPVIASGGVGTLEHLVEGIRDGHASAVLAASIFHFGTFRIAEAKAYLAKAGHSRAPIASLVLGPPAEGIVAEIDGSILDRLYATIVARRGADPATSYTAKLMQRRHEPHRPKTRRGGGRDGDRRARRARPRRSPAKAPISSTICWCCGRMRASRRPTSGARSRRAWADLGIAEKAGRGR